METDRERTYIVGVGAANVDSHWQSLAPVNLRDSNPSHCRLSVGGVTRNICENLARLGEKVYLLSAVGDDVYGEMIVRESEAAGINLRYLDRKKNTSSSSYIAVLDEKGDMLLGLSDMRIINDMPVSYIEKNAELIQNAAAVVCDGALPREIFLSLQKLAPGRCYIDPVSIAYARNMSPAAGGFQCIKPNRYELEVLADMKVSSDEDICRAVDRLLEKGTESVAVSLGERGCYYADRSGTRMFRAIEPLTVMADATGAGDAFTAGLIHAAVRGYNTERMLYTALAAGRISAESPLTVSPEMSPQAIEKTLKEHSEYQL